MPNDLIVRILGDASGFERSLKASTATATGFERTLKKTAVTAEESARAQVAASVRKDERLRSEIATYRAVAAAAAKGSQEQIVAANLADRAQARLARSMGVSAEEARHLSASTHRLERDISHASRGVISGSGIFRSFGRSLAFASGGFLAFGGASAFLRTSIDAARDAQVVNRQLAQQLENNGRSFGDYREQIDKTTNRLAALAGIENDELKAGLTTILRTTPNVGKALRDLGTAADLARARHISLAAASTIMAKTEAGNTTLLRRQGFQIGKNATAEQALAIVRAKVAGQARAGTTEQERFGAVLHDTEEIVGFGVLPTLNKYLSTGSQWLEQMNESGRLQRDVAHAAHDFETVIRDVVGAVRTVDDVTGGFKNTLEILLALKVAGWASGVAGSIVTVVGGLSRARFGATSLGGKLAVGNASLAAQAGVASFAITTLGLKATGTDKTLRRLGGSAEDALAKTQKFGIADPVVHPIVRALGASDRLGRFGGTDSSRDKPGQVGGVDVKNVELFVHRLEDAGRSTDETMMALERRFKQLSEGDMQILLRIAEKTRDAYRAAGGAATEAAAKAAHGLALAAAARRPAVTSGTAAATRGLNLTATQRNTFFDNAIARILLRGGLGGIEQQTRALEQADTLLRQRIAKTKDVTRRLNLEDQLLQNEAQLRALGAQRRTEAAGRRNTFFDNAIARVLLRGGLGDVPTQIAALQRADTLIRQRIGVTKDVTRRLTLEDELLQNESRVRELRAQQAADAVKRAADRHQKALDALAASTGQAEFRVTVAQATAGYGDDIAALQRLQRAILAQIRAEGHTAELESQLFQTRQDIAAARLSRTTGREFRALGFTATGDAVTPTRRNLQRQLGQLRATLESSSLDSPKFRAELNRIRKVLDESLVPPGIRQRMQQMLADLRNQLKGHVGDVTRYGHASGVALTRGLGLEGGVRRTLETRIAQAGAGGSVPRRGAAFALAAGGVTVNGGVHLHGIQNVRHMEDELAKRARSRPAKRRG